MEYKRMTDVLLSTVSICLVLK